MHLVIVMPALNESATIGEVISSLPEKFAGINRVNVVVVDDGSTDNTREIASDRGAVVVSHSKNLGVGAAFQTGVNKALDLKADIMVNIDADGQFDTSDIPSIINPLIEGEADFVTASRFLDKNLRPVMPWIKYLGNKAMSLLISKLTKRKFYDVSCGFRAYSKESLLRLNLFGKFTYTQETFIDLAFKGLRIKELPVRVKGVREHGKSRVASNLFKYGLNSLRIILHSFIDYRPLSVFGALAFILFLVGVPFGMFFIIHYLKTGKFSPHIWAGFTSGFFVVMSFVVFVFSLLGDMLSRMRLNQEEILYNIKKEKSQKQQ
jgi:glycosyltransferase involved in cell wall biosynthesis